MEKMKMSEEKEYSCNITIKFGGNFHQATSESEYIEKLKEAFYENYGIDLEDNDITDIEENE